MISSKGQGCGDVAPVGRQKSRRDAGVTEWTAGPLDGFLLLVEVLIEGFDARVLLGADAL
jgi:hypothetical protein